MSIIDTSVPMTITAPSGVDGQGAIAVLNNPADTNFVGYLFDVSGFDGANVRTSTEDRPQAQGATFGSFWHGSRSFTLEVALQRSATWSVAFARRDKLYQATNAMAADGTIVWTETG